MTVTEGTPHVPAGRLRAAAAVAEHVGIAPAIVLAVWRFTPEAMIREDRAENTERRRKIIDGAREQVRIGVGTDQREQHDILDRTVVFDSGRQLEGRRVRDPIEEYARLKRITPRQAKGAQLFREDWELGIWGARNPEASTGTSKAGGGFSQSQLLAAEGYAGACERLGKAFRPLVELVVLAGEWLDDIAKRRADEDTSVRSMEDKLRWHLRAGLDILGDAYGEPAELVSETFATEDREIRIVYRHEADSSVSAVNHSGLPWETEANSVAELRRKAEGFVRHRRELRAVPT